MGSLCLKPEKPAVKTVPGKYNSDPNRRVDITEADTVLAKMKIAEDKLQDRVHTLESRKMKLHQKIKELVSQKKKEETYFLLNQMRTINTSIKSTYKKMEILDQQVMAIESAQEDAQFTQVLKDSNKAIENLNKEIDLDQLRVMKELEMEGKLRREEIDSMLTDSEEDRALKAELDMIETALLEKNFDQVKFNTQIDDLLNRGQGEVKKSQMQSSVRRSQFYENKKAALAN